MARKGIREKVPTSSHSVGTKWEHCGNSSLSSRDRVGTKWEDCGNIFGSDLWFYRKNSGIGKKQVVKEKDGNREDRPRDVALGRAMGSSELRI